MTKIKHEFIKGKNNIGYVSDSFLQEFGNDELTEGKILPFQKLQKNMYDSEILSELKVQECTLGDVLETIKNAPQELKDGYSNIFYIKGSRVVGVRWGDGGWRVDGWGRGGGWLRGRRVFSPATSDAGIIGAGSLGSLDLESAIRIVKKSGYKIYKEI
jgi:hypothetical protein